MSSDAAPRGHYFTIRNGEIGTKHVYVGDTRMVSKMVKRDPQAEARNQYFYHPDHLGSSSYVTDSAGQVYEHLEYFPFGETWVEESSNTQRTPYLFSSKELDEETGLYYYGARYYDPRTSVWQSTDPLLVSDPEKALSRPQLLDAYSYASQSPLVYTDPDGRDVLVVVGRAKNKADRKLDQAVLNKLRSELTGAGIPFKVADVGATKIKSSKSALQFVKKEADSGGASHPVTGVVVLSHGAPKGMALAFDKKATTGQQVADAAGLRSGGALAIFACRVGQGNTTSLDNDSVSVAASKERMNFYNNGMVSFDSNPGARTSPGQTVFPGRENTVLDLLRGAEGSAGKMRVDAPMGTKQETEIKLDGN